MGAGVAAPEVAAPPAPALALDSDPETSAGSDEDDDVTQDWLVVVEDLASVRTIEIGDVLQQRVRNRPKLARWDATEDMLIENPLEEPENPTTDATYAKMARPSYAQAFKMSRKEAAWNPPPAIDASTGRIWTPLAAGGPSSIAAERAAMEAQYGPGKGDSHDWCSDSRIVRRMKTRVFGTTSKGMGYAKPVNRSKVFKPRTRNVLSRPI